MNFSTEVAGATVGAHIDSFWEYNRLVGESDGGELLGEAPGGLLDTDSGSCDCVAAAWLHSCSAVVRGWLRAWGALEAS